MLPDEVQVWRLDLTCATGQEWVEAGWGLLSADETARARRMRAGNSRDEMVAARAALRCLLACEVGCYATEVEFRIGEHGKPSLFSDKLAFNVTHSHGMVLIALSRAGAVGIDVEDPLRPIEALEVARTAFHPEEVRCLIEAAEAERAAMFYRFWTRKEAVAKADGRGLMLHPQSFSVVKGGYGVAIEAVCHQNGLGCGEQPADEVAVLGRYHQSYYHLLDLCPGRGFIGALALGRRIDLLAQYDIYPAHDLTRGASLVEHVFEMA